MSSGYVVAYDNGSGYLEWACSPQPTEEAAAIAGDFNPAAGDRLFWVDGDQDKDLRPCQCGSGQPWVSCGARSQYCG